MGIIRKDRHYLGQQKNDKDTNNGRQKNNLSNMSRGELCKQLSTKKKLEQHERV